MLWPRLSTRDGSRRAGSTGPRRDLPGRTATAAVPAAPGVRDSIVCGREVPLMAAVFLWILVVVVMSFVAI